jgi:hypothetical protein
MSHAQPIELLKEPMALSLYLDTGAIFPGWYAENARKV